MLKSQPITWTCTGCSKRGVPGLMVRRGKWMFCAECISLEEQDKEAGAE